MPRICRRIWTDSTPVSRYRSPHTGVGWFWTYGGSNCLQILPELCRQEEKYPGGRRSRYNTQIHRPSGEMLRRVVRAARRLLDRLA